MTNRIYVINDKGSIRILADQPFEYVYISPEDCIRVIETSVKLTGGELKNLEHLRDECKEYDNLEKWSE